jgi:hypothetical protein
LVIKNKEDIFVTLKSEVKKTKEENKLTQDMSRLAISANEDTNGERVKNLLLEADESRKVGLCRLAVTDKEVLSIQEKNKDALHGLGEKTFSP